MKVKIYELEGTLEEVTEFAVKINKQIKHPNKLTYKFGPPTIGASSPSNPLDWCKITCSDKTSE